MPLYIIGWHGYPSITYTHLKNPIFTFNLLPISIVTTPNENWGKNMCVYDNGKGVKILVVVQLHTHNSLTGLAISTKLCEYINLRCTSA